MKKFIILLLAIIPFLAEAQTGGNKSDDIRAAKAAYITQRLNLTPDQAQKFWPLYNEYDDKRKGYLKELRQIRIKSNNVTATDAEMKTTLDEFFALRQKNIDLDKEYYAKFLTVITPRQAVELVKAEKDFLKKLLQGAGGAAGTDDE